ncbi:hypothetical protein [Streptomyces durocortorensis]|uniref:Transposase n=1 Tax=Streptomyces durocortorensis TaxID=2811104 RepID=A0ABS2HTD0_9ACTN|nr:hypothetical protein [Streptomyces durocortorensis]MBM7054304.1 hypothetical protein [Streptomyces durocortorensis]
MGGAGADCKGRIGRYAVRMGRHKRGAGAVRVGEKWIAQALGGTSAGRADADEVQIRVAAGLKWFVLETSVEDELDEVKRNGRQVLLEWSAEPTVVQPTVVGVLKLVYTRTAWLTASSM